MKWLLFLSRLAFITGFCFLLSLSLLIKDWIKEQDLASMIILIGTFMGMLVVPATLICYLAVLFTKRKLNTIVPAWLIACNIVWMFVYLFYLIFLNGQGNHTS
jgi:hypothetical protein